jgi:biotin carboxyl carrier protein
VPEAGRQRDGQENGSDSSRLADHAGIARLTEELLPALIAKLSTTQLGELEVREGDWQIRLRRPYGVGPGEGRRVTDKPSRSQPGHEGHGHGRAGVEGHRGGRAGGSGGSGGAGGSSASSGAGAGASSSASSSSTASSPAVGIFNPGPKATSGTRVRAGDILGTVNMLGIPQEIAAPADGIVGATLVEAGTAVEYGQDLIRLELTGPAAPKEA